MVGRAASQCSAPPDLLPSEARALLQPTPPPIPARNAEHIIKNMPSSEKLTEKVEDKQPRMRFEVC